MTDSSKQISEIEKATLALAKYKHVIDDDLASYGPTILAKWKQDYGSAAEIHLEAYVNILLRGGKRLRGALAMYSYELAGGNDLNLSKASARCIEAIHAYLLVVDDVADKSALRRGGPSAHQQLADYHSQHGWHGDSLHYGNSQAVHAALAGAHLAIQEITDLPIDDSYKIKALSALNHGLATTVAGQIRDVYNQAVQNISEAEVREVLTMKTAYYSFLNPLEFGLNLAGSQLSEYPWLKNYATHVGLSFQIVDDIIGTFGNPKKSGKGTTDDLSEGKITVLVSHALAKANNSQKQKLLAILGKSNITTKEHEIAKSIIQETGALEYSRQLASSQMKLAIQALKSVPDNISTNFLSGLADYIIKRNN